MREDLDWGYGAAVSALSFADNALSVTLGPGERPGDPAVLTVVPSSPRFRVESQVITGGAEADEDVILRRLPGPGPVVAVLSGVVPRGGAWEGEIAVEDPALFAVTVLAEVLSFRGVSVAGGVGTTSEPLPSGLRVVAAHEGAPLSRLVEEVNKESQNLHAELLLRRLAARADGPGTTEAGLEAVTAFLDRLSVPRSGWGLKDGSGLSHTNLVTPRGLVALLVAMDRHPAAAAFHASLPVAGRDGSLERRMRGTPAEGRVEAKPGTLQGVNALAGHATTSVGDRLAFVIMVNNHVHRSALAREAIDAVVLALATAR
jgi:D-alanyl-D-alanine carboxypeptidase/D-alanyl-D-alanine-endopeptidase (penicillin-binding protein 4)